LVLADGDEIQVESPKLVVLYLIHPLLDPLLGGATKDKRESLLASRGRLLLAVQSSFLGHFN
jgi:hypothetical protein